MIHLTYSNRTEALLARLVERLDARRARGVDPLAPVRIVVPNRNVERYVETGVARGLGIAANLRFSRLSRFVTEWLSPPGAPGLLLGDALLGRVLGALTDEALLADPSLGPVRRYLFSTSQEPDAVDRRRAQLALHLAHLFEEYGYSRPELLDAWDAGERRFTAHPTATEEEAWQATLYAHLRAAPPRARTLREALRARLGEPTRQGPPTGGEYPTGEGHPTAEGDPSQEVHVFGLSYVARVFAEVYDVRSRDADLFLYALNPCEEYWEDLETAAELRRRRKKSDAEPTWTDEEDPFRLSVERDSPLLRRLGRPGREHVRLLGALTDCDFDAAFEDPRRSPVVAAEGADEALPLFARIDRPSLLHKLQHDVLTRAPNRRRVEPAPIDESVLVLACPSVRREVETVVAHIRALVETLGDLSFDQIAVLLNGPDQSRYLPHIEAVFEEAGAIPYTLADLSLASANPLVEGALRLLALPESELRRPDLLGVITHPSVVASFPDRTAADFVDLVDQLGIVFGLDRETHRGTYLEGEDALSWDQGITRVTLGAFMDEGPVTVDGRRYLPEGAALADDRNAEFAMLCRSLYSDVRFAREARRPLADWARFMSAMIRVYLTPRGPDDEAALSRVQEALGDLGALDLDEASGPVGYALAHELARARLEGLSTGRGQTIGDGVAVSSLLPMRAIPFRVIFALGLGEGHFPASERADAMDLRAVRPSVGDVSAKDRDRYTFLETLLSARERLILSYVAREESTGDALAPSIVIAELLETIEQNHVPDAGRLGRRVPLHRHEDDAVCRVLPSASAERQARALGEAFFRDAPELADGARLREIARARPRIEAALGWAPLPDLDARRRIDERAGKRIDLPIRALRRFLESPLQGWTRAALGLAEADLGTRQSLTDEPFRATSWETTGALRGAFERHAALGETLDLAYRSAVEPRQLAGRWPLGAFARIEAARHRDVLTGWAAQLAQHGGEPGALRRIRIGRGRPTEGRGEVLPPLSFDSVTVGDVEVSLALHGQTELLTSSASVLPVVRHKGGALGGYDELRHALRGLFDHVVLTAAGLPAPTEAVQLYGDGHAAAAFDLSSIERAEARRWLVDVATELLTDAHEYVLPIEAVARVLDRPGRADGDAVVRAVEVVRERFGGGQSRWGPVRDPERYPPPSPERAARIVERRFGLLRRTLNRREPRSTR